MCICKFSMPSGLHLTVRLPLQIQNLFIQLKMNKKRELQTCSVDNLSVTSQYIGY